MPVIRASTTGSAVMLSIARYGSPPHRPAPDPGVHRDRECAQLLLDVPAEQPVAAEGVRVHDGDRHRVEPGAQDPLRSRAGREQQADERPTRRRRAPRPPSAGPWP